MTKKMSRIALTDRNQCWASSAYLPVSDITASGAEIPAAAISHDAANNRSQIRLRDHRLDQKSDRRRRESWRSLTSTKLLLASSKIGKHSVRHEAN